MYKIELIQYLIYIHFKYFTVLLLLNTLQENECLSLIYFVLILLYQLILFSINACARIILLQRAVIGFHQTVVDNMLQIRHG